VRFRIDGVLADVMRVPKTLRAKLTSRIKIMANINIAEKRIAQDGRMTVVAAGTSVSIRVVTLPTPHGEAVVMRILEESTGLLALDQLGFQPDARKRYEAIFRRPWGAILVTGPTGSGKSTTLYATIAEINDPGRNIVTVEDPIEYELDGIKQIQLNIKAGMSFPVALRSILRADPDVVLVGEIRDVETARIATEAALTGHLMLSSLHTNTAASAPMRLVDMGIEPFLVTSTVIGVVGQRLARRLCDRCKEAYEPSAEEINDAFGGKGLPGDGPLYRSVGCVRCSQTGYRGRIAIQEVLPISDELHPLILGRAAASQIEAAAIEAGMVTMREDGLHKVVAGLTSVNEVFRAIG
jgi:type IV pilus assembly protein PilB